MTTHSPAFRTTMRQIAQGDILAPALRAYLMDPAFKGFTIEVRGVGRRAPDGWFHSSEHPALPERVLWLYLRQPELLIIDPPDPLGVLSMTAGSIWHSIVGKILGPELGILQGVEVRVQDDETHSRGSMDGTMAEEIYELKTMKDARLVQIATVEDYIAKYPTYYLQAIDYMRMSGYRRERVLLMALTYPYEMRELVIEYDHAVAKMIRDKYMTVRQALADQRMPLCSGCVKGNKCPARAVCEETKFG